MPTCLPKPPAARWSAVNACQVQDAEGGRQRGQECIDALADVGLRDAQRAESGAVFEHRCKREKIARLAPRHPEVCAVLQLKTRGSRKKSLVVELTGGVLFRSEKWKCEDFGEGR